MKKIKVYVKKFTTKDGREFYKATCKGQYLPLLEADEEEFYNKNARWWHKGYINGYMV